MSDTYYAIRRKHDGKIMTPAGVSKAPHLYLTKGKAEGAYKSRYAWHHEEYEIVPFQLIEIKEKS